MTMRSTAPVRSWSDVARGALATLGVLVLVVGVPTGLVVWVGWPLPTEVPRLDRVAEALRDTYIPDELLVKALAVVCWLVWVELVAALLIEAVALAKGREAARLPLTSSGVQRAAARLVATCALLGALAATRGVPDIADRPLHPPPAAQLTIGGHTEMDQPGPLTAPTGDSRQHRATGAPEQSADPSPVYEVRRRDTLWRIAECHLGDPLRWREIYELNRGLPQADGRTLTDPDTIRPGWALRLPADATDLPPASPDPSSRGAQPGGPTQPSTADGHAGADAAASDRRDRSPTPDTGHPDDGMVLVDDDLVPADATLGGRTADDLVAGPPRPAGPTGGTPPPSSTDGRDDLVASGPPHPISPPAPPPPPTSPVTGDGMVLLPEDLVTEDGASTTDDDWMVARGDDRRR